MDVTVASFHMLVAEEKGGGESEQNLAKWVNENYSENIGQKIKKMFSLKKDSCDVYPTLFSKTKTKQNAIIGRL